MAIWNLHKPFDGENLSQGSCSFDYIHKSFIRCKHKGLQFSQASIFSYKQIEDVNVKESAYDEPAEN